MPDRKMTNDEWDAHVANLRSSGWADDDPSGQVPPTDEPRPWGTCVLCDEPIGHYDAWVPLNAQQLAHHECSLREVMGGIGHHLGHDYWCAQQRDTDAGLTYRQSAVLVKVLVELLGVEEVVRRGAVKDFNP